VVIGSLGIGDQLPFNQLPIFRRGKSEHQKARCWVIPRKVETPYGKCHRKYTAEELGVGTGLVPVRTMDNYKSLFLRELPTNSGKGEKVW